MQGPIFFATPVKHIRRTSETLSQMQQINCTFPSYNSFFICLLLNTQWHAYKKLLVKSSQNHIKITSESLICDFFKV